MNVLFRPVSTAQCFLVIIAAISSLALIYASSTTGIATNAVHFSSFHLDKHAKETAKQAVLQWMKENSDMSDQVLAKIYNAAATTANRDLILAICLVESNFNPHAESEMGAIGLMGVRPVVWLEELKERGIVNEREDLYKISSNIAAGAYVLATYLSETNDLRQALIRYVGGASWYATKVLRAQKTIELAHLSEEQLALTVIQE
jgi:soluble lytic murein transglycosylase-like protein